MRHWSRFGWYINRRTQLKPNITVKTPGWPETDFGSWLLGFVSVSDFKPDPLIKWMLEQSSLWGWWAATSGHTETSILPELGRFESMLQERTLFLSTMYSFQETWNMHNPMDQGHQSLLKRSCLLCSYLCTCPGICFMNSELFEHSQRQL